MSDTKKPRRMWNDPERMRQINLPEHGGAHDQNPACGCEPRCTPLREGALDAAPDKGARGYEPPPNHYAGHGGLDPWAVWDAFDLDRYTANAVKYLLRAGRKDIAPRLDDLRKAANYIAKAIEMEEGRA